jgi:hypothetical protein
MLDGHLVAYAFTGGLVETGRVRLALGDAPDLALPLIDNSQGGWADRDHFFVVVDESVVVKVNASAMTEVPVPRLDRFTAPKPPPDPTGDEFEAATRAQSIHITTGLIVEPGAAWVSVCAWGLNHDGIRCHRYVHAKLWPDTKIVVGDHTARRPRAWAWPSTPPGYKLAVDSTAASCEHGGKKSVFDASSPDVGGVQIHSAHFVSKSPPHLLVVYGHFGLGSVVADRWTLHRGCALPPIAEGQVAEPGPDELWLASVGGERPARVIYRGGNEIGRLPENTPVWFRPPK